MISIIEFEAKEEKSELKDEERGREEVKKK